MNDKTYKESPEKLLLGLVPDDGESIGNRKLQQRFLQVADDHGFKVTERDFVALKESLVTSGALVLGRGRGGSVRRAQGAGDDFALDTQTPTPDSGKRKSARAAPKRKQSGKRTKGGDEAKIVSYRYDDMCKNNPPVGLVKPASNRGQTNRGQTTVSNNRV
ncbi:MAG: hypothetical protein WCC36_12485 [Gammaproteobacteria bacterium]